jgi:uncharacterized membrane protein YdjX (TVP38/TMEM64 family)
MSVWSGARTMGWSTRAVIAAGLLAVLLVAAVPAALLVGVILMLFGHVVVGLALFGASVLAAVAAVVIASLSGVRHLRKLVSRKLGGQKLFSEQQNDRIVQLRQDDYHFD